MVLQCNFEWRAIRVLKFDLPCLRVAEVVGLLLCPIQTRYPTQPTTANFWKGVQQLEDHSWYFEKETLLENSQHFLRTSKFMLE